MGPTVHPPLIDILLLFGSEGPPSFCVEGNPRQRIQYYRMTRLTFGVSASSLSANMVLRQNALEHLETHPQAARVALDCFYVDDGLMGADSIDEAIQLRREQHDLFDQGGFKIKE